MTLQLKTKARLFDLHCSVGLTDWDLDKELKLATTTDQFYHGDRFYFSAVFGFRAATENQFILKFYTQKQSK